MRKHSTIEVAEMFAQELSKLHTQMDWADYKESTLNLSVEFKHGKARAEVRFSQGYGSVSVNGASLAEVMAEVRRRLNYNDKAEGQISEASEALIALPAPADGEDA
jgi:hypothetical protein